MHSSTNQAFAIKACSDTIKKESTSGGTFYLIAQSVILQGGSVYGAAYMNSFHVSHIRVDSLDGLKKLRNSKYVQSEIGNTYTLVEQDLKNLPLVLFSGTSCQIAGLRSSLTECYSNLYTIDVICHGVPAPFVWETYVKMLEKENHSEVISIKCRDQEENGWSGNLEHFKVKFLNGANLSQCLLENPYMLGFLKDIYLRDSCYHCYFKNKEFQRVSDLTLGDYWGCEKEEPEFFDKNGVSLALVNTQKGLVLLKSMQDYEIKETNLVNASRYNNALMEPFRKYAGSYWFYWKWNSERSLMDFERLIKKCLKINKIHAYIRRVIGKLRR
jgi:hypothetical protein